MLERALLLTYGAMVLPIKLYRPPHAGTYTVTGTDANGCTASDSMVIDVLTVDITQNDTTICEGDSLVLLANGTQTYPQVQITVNFQDT